MRMFKELDEKIEEEKEYRDNLEIEFHKADPTDTNYLQFLVKRIEKHEAYIKGLEEAKEIIKENL